MEQLTRKEAIRRGLKKYYTGKPCINGHIDLRHTLTSACRSCLRGYQQKGLSKTKENLDGWKDITVRIRIDHEDKIMAYVKLLIKEELLK